MRGLTHRIYAYHFDVFFQTGNFCDFGHFVWIIEYLAGGSGAGQ